MQSEIIRRVGYLDLANSIDQSLSGFGQKDAGRFDVGLLDQ